MLSFKSIVSTKNDYLPNGNHTTFQLFVRVKITEDIEPSTYSGGFIFPYEQVVGINSVRHHTTF